MIFRSWGIMDPERWFFNSALICVSLTFHPDHCVTFDPVSLSALCHVFNLYHTYYKNFLGLANQTMQNLISPLTFFLDSEVTRVARHSVLP